MLADYQYFYNYTASPKNEHIEPHTEMSDTSYIYDQICYYFQSIGKLKQLDAEQERYFLSRLNEPDEQIKKMALEKLVLGCQYLVIEEVLYFCESGIEYQDLIQQANLILVRALFKVAQTPESIEKTPLKGYLHFRLYRYLTNFVYENVSVVRFPANRQKEVLENAEELGDYLESNVSCSVKRVVSDDIDRDPKHLWKEYPYFRIENIAVENISDIVTTSDYCHNVIKGDLVYHLAFLSKIEEEIIKKYYGLNDYMALTLVEISKDYSLTRERIRQLKERAIEKLQHPSRKRILSSYNISYDHLLYSNNFELDRKIQFSGVLTDPPHNILTEDKKAYSMLRESTNPFRRINRIPGINNMASVCRNQIVRLLSEVDHPISKANITKSILEMFPSMSETIIEYAISTTDGIEISMGEYVLSSKKGKDVVSRIRLSPFFREYEIDLDEESFS
jgi:RNA polymerase primary sigma factor